MKVFISEETRVALGEIWDFYAEWFGPNVYNTPSAQAIKKVIDAYDEAENNGDGY